MAVILIGIEKGGMFSTENINREKIPLFALRILSISWFWGRFGKVLGNYVNYLINCIRGNNSVNSAVNRKRAYVQQFSCM